MPREGRPRVCPWYRHESGCRLSCDGGQLKFADAQDRLDYVCTYCAEIFGWQECSIAKSLGRAYERRNEKGGMT